MPETVTISDANSAACEAIAQMRRPKLEVYNPKPIPGFRLLDPVGLRITEFHYRAGEKKLSLWDVEESNGSYSTTDNPMLSLLSLNRLGYTYIVKSRDHSDGIDFYNTVADETNYVHRILRSVRSSSQNSRKTTGLLEEARGLVEGVRQDFQHNLTEAAKLFDSMKLYE